MDATQLQAGSGEGKLWKARYTVLLLIWLGWMFSFLDRMIMSVSLPFIGKDLNLDATAQGWIISAFFIGYAGFQIPGGWLGDKFGPRKVMTFAITWWSIFTSLTGMVLSYPVLLTIRFLFGIGEGCFPASSWKSIATYFPPRERGRATAIQSSVNTLGPAMAAIIAAAIIAAFGWHMVFIAMGIAGLFIAVGMYLCVRDNPQDHPQMTAEELAELPGSGMASGASAVEEQVPFMAVLKSPVLWQMAFIWFLFDITFWGFSSWLPSYLMKVRGFSLAKTGVAAAIPFLCGTVGTLLGGYYSDKGKNTRKWLYVVASIVSSGFLYMVYTVADANTAVVYQCVSSFFMFFAMGLFWGILMDQIPTKIMGRASGIVNFGGQMAGVVSPPIMGYLIERSGGSYDSSFVFMIMALAASAVFTAMLKNTSTQQA